MNLSLLNESIALILEVLNKKQLIAKYPERAEEIEELSKRIEPKFLQWVVDLTSDENKKTFVNQLAPTFDSIFKVLNDFNAAAKSGNKYVNPDIYSYSTNSKGWHELVDKLTSWKRTHDTTKRRSMKQTDQAISALASKEPIAKGDNWELFQLENKEEACELGAGTNWCISVKGTNNSFDTYTKVSSIFMYIDHSLPTYDPLSRIAIVNHRMGVNDFFDTSDRRLNSFPGPSAVIEKIDSIDKEDVESTLSVNELYDIFIAYTRSDNKDFNEIVRSYKKTFKLTDEQLQTITRLTQEAIEFEDNMNDTETKVSKRDMKELLSSIKSYIFSLTR